MKTLTALFLLVSLFINSLFAGLVTNPDYGLDSLALKSHIEIPADSIIDIDSLLGDTTLFKEVSVDTLVHADSLINADTLNIAPGGKALSDTVVVKKDTVSKPSVPKKPVVVIPQSVIELNKI